MAWKQLKDFNVNRMGTEKGWCLRNVAKGFGVYGVPGALPSAKADMEFNKNRGTLHNLPAPTNVAVPVYVDTSSKYEHVMVCDHGVYYSDGRRLTSIAGMKIFGWGEFCNSVRVVEWVNDPQPTTGFLPAKGYWCRYDIDPRVGQLASFMRSVFPAYTPAAALGNKYGDNLWRSIKEFQRRTGLEQDGNTGPITYAKLKQYGFKG